MEGAEFTENESGKEYVRELGGDPEDNGGLKSILGVHLSSRGLVEGQENDSDALQPAFLAVKNI